MEVHWYPTKRYILGTPESSAVYENSFFSPYSPEAIWRVSEKDCWVNLAYACVKAEPRLCVCQGVGQKNVRNMTKSGQKISEK